MLSKKIKSKIKGFVRKFALIPLYRIKLRHAQEYKPPQDKELEMIEQEFINSGIKIHQFYVDITEYENFKIRYNFPALLWWNFC